MVISGPASLQDAVFIPATDDSDSTGNAPRPPQQSTHLHSLRGREMRLPRFRDPDTSITWNRDYRNGGSTQIKEIKVTSCRIKPWGMEL